MRAAEDTSSKIKRHHERQILLSELIDSGEGLVGKEGDLFRFTLWHSIVMVLAMSVIVYLQAYWLKCMLP